jgi:hypothetical protein
MWCLLRRKIRPDASYWPGRRILAALDAVAWPCGWIVVAFSLRERTGLVGSVVVVFALLVSVRRIHRAIWNNGRYFFSTLRWGRAVVLVILIGIWVKLVLDATQ